MFTHIPDFDAARPHMQSMERGEGDAAVKARQKLADSLVWMEGQGVKLPPDYRLFMEKYRTK